MKVRLQTEKGELVHEEMIPAFNAAPDYIVWGSRFFLYSDSALMDGGTVLSVYAELSFGYFLPTVAPAPDKAKTH